MTSYCFNCGETGPYTTGLPVDDALQRTWEISDKMAALFNRREGYICSTCGANIRAQGLAKAILDSAYGFGKRSLREWVDAANAKELKVCELNSCHELHKTLLNLNGLTYAEYGTPTEENIEQLSYKDDTFDLLLHSETVEHVNSPGAAMNECRRVIKPQGLVLFTAPIIWGRKTRRRAKLEAGKITYLLEASYHGKKADDYLVYHEYGRDIDQLLGVGLCYNDWKNQNYVFFSNKQGATINPVVKLSMLLLEKIALLKET